MPRLLSFLALLCALCATGFPNTASAAPAVRTVKVMISFNGPPLAADANLKDRSRATLFRDRLDATLPAARRYSGALTGYQKQEIAYLQAHGIDLHVGRTFTVLFDGISATIPANQENALRHLTNVSGVLPIRTYYPLLDKSTQLIGAQDAWGQLGGGPNAGKGMMIADIDTGIDVKNPCFSDTGFTPSPFGRRADNSTDYGLTNNKVIVARAYGSDPSQQYTAQDTIGHGTFTGAIEACDYNTPTPLGPKISGVAPGAYLLDYNVFPGGAGTTDDSSIVAALQAALLDGADVANLSLGGTASDPSLDLESQEVDLATKAGLTVVVSAGNAGPTPQTIGAPAVAPSAIAVGATTNSRFVSSSTEISGADVPDQLKQMRSTEGSHSYTNKVGPAPIVYVGLGRMPNDDDANPTANDFAGKDLHGKIALIKRGTLLFETKINNAMKAGAVGVIVFDNSLEPSLITMAMNTATLPSMFISQADGNALVDYVQAHPDAQATLDPSLTTGTETPDVLSDFSSVGYSANYAIKPDLVAPGQDIYAATQSAETAGDMYNASGFTSASGTSFSAPHVAGAVALVLEKHPKWTPAQVKSALVETATQNVLLAAGDATVPSITQMGGGLADVPAALAATALASPSSLTFGEANVAGGTVQQTFNLSLSDAGGGAGAWKVSIDSLHGSNPAFTLTVPSSVSVPSGGQVNVPVQMSAAAAAANSDYDGYIVLTNGSQTLHVPYLAHVVNGPVQEGTVLLVDASTSRYLPSAGDTPQVHKDVSSYYFNALKADGIPYTYWDESKLGSPSYNDMKRASAVIVFTGNNLAGYAGNSPESPATPLSTLDTSALHSYLNGGGHVFISGIGAPASDVYFSAVMLGAADASFSIYDNSTNDKAQKGGISPPQPSAVPDKRIDVHSNPYVFGNMKAIDFSTKGDGAGTNVAILSRAVSDMFGVNGLQPFFGDAAPFGHAYGEAALRTTDLSLAEGGADVAIVSSDEPSFTHKVSFPGRAVTFSFGFEGINDNTGYATREQVLQRIFQWFNDKPTATVTSTAYRHGVLSTLRAGLKALKGVRAETYAWKVGSKTLKATTTSTRYTFPAAGTYRLRVEITDSLGHVAVSAPKTVHVG